jgi:hypothetical protein
MTPTVSERALLGVRTLLLLGWGVLILSLFWDPVLIRWTHPGSPWAWVWLGQPSLIQGRRFVEAPYAVGAHVFWTFIVPVVPLFLMVFGHTVWRRICPLAFLSRLPAYLGIQRNRAGSDRAALIGPGHWLRRHAWTVQFWLLVAALAVRLLFIDSDRLALGLFLTAILATAFAVGLFWGGRTWCHTICPVHIVEMMYTGQAGLIGGSKSQSACRTLDGGPGCVGCVKACADIDPAKSYVLTLERRDVRSAYYGFFGLIAGFYAYFFLYTGDWNHYFSGDWSHVPSQLAELSNPGFYIAGHPLPIPKWLAAPATLIAAVLAGMASGIALERLLEFLAPATDPALLRHRLLAVTAYASITLFYVFSGRSNLALLPQAAQTAVDGMLLALASAWLVKALRFRPGWNR